MPLEKPTLRMRLGRIWRIYVKGNVLLKRLQRDPETGGYKIVVEETTRAELPIEAVHQSGHGSVFWVDEIKVKHPFNVNDNGFTAIDLNLWMESNEINEALALKWHGLESMDVKKVGFFGIVAVAAVIIVWVFMGGMQ